jgi:hypothetical protein
VKRRQGRNAGDDCKASGALEPPSRRLCYPAVNDPIHIQRNVMGFLDLLLGKPEPSLPISNAADFSSLNIARLTDAVYDLLYNKAYAERCHRDGQNACSAWLHGQMDHLGIVHSQHERLIILAKFRNGDRSLRDLPKS